MRCCSRLSDFASLTASYPELQGTTVLDLYAACGIGACANLMSKQLKSGTALSQDHFTAFITQILPALILRQYADAAELVRLACALFFWLLHWAFEPVLFHYCSGIRFTVAIMRHGIYGIFPAEHHVAA